MRILASSLSLLLLLQGTLFAYSAESNFWKERRLALGPPVSVPPPAPFERGTRDELQTPLSQFGTIRPKPNLESRFLKRRSTDQTLIFHIQDVHRNPDAQINIGRTVDYLLHHEKIDLIALEGAFGPVDLSWFRRFSHQETKKIVSDLLFDNQKINGTVHALLLTPASLPPVIGIDDKNHYESNVAAYRQSAKSRILKSREIRNYKSKIQNKKRGLFNPELMAFDDNVQAFRKGEIELGAYAQILAERQKGVSKSMATFRKAVSLESSLDFSNVDAERVRLIADLSRKLNPTGLSELTNRAVSYRTGRLRHTDFYRYLKESARRRGVSLRSYPALDDYVRYVLLADSIDADSLFQELRRAEEAVYESLIDTERERALIKESRRLYLEEKLVRFALTKDEWEDYKAILAAKPSEDSSLVSFERFYEEAEARDKAMAKNLQAAMETVHAKTAILVTGGFHAEGVKSYVERSSSEFDQGLSIINFVPRISRMEGSSYLSVFTQEKTPLEKLFAGQKLFLAPRAWTRFHVIDSQLLLAMEGSLLIGAVPHVKTTAGRVFYSARPFLIAADKIGNRVKTLPYLVPAPAAAFAAGVALLWITKNLPLAFFGAGVVMALLFIAKNGPSALRRAVPIQAKRLVVSNGLLLLQPYVGFSHLFSKNQKEPKEAKPGLGNETGKYQRAPKMETFIPTIGNYEEIKRIVEKGETWGLKPAVQSPIGFHKFLTDEIILASFDSEADLIAGYLVLKAGPGYFELRGYGLRPGYKNYKKDILTFLLIKSHIALDHKFILSKARINDFDRLNRLKSDLGLSGLNTHQFQELRRREAIVIPEEERGDDDVWFVFPDPEKNGDDIYAELAKRDRFDRPAVLRPKDRPSRTVLRRLARIDEKTEADDPEFKSPFTAQDLFNLGRSAGHQFLFVSLFGMPVGYLLFNVYRGGVHLRHLVIHPDFRRRKLGTELMKGLVFLSRELGQPVLLMRTGSSHVALHEFLRAFGFKRTVIPQEDTGNRRFQYHFKLDLSGHGPRMNNSFFAFLLAPSLGLAAGLWIVIFAFLLVRAITNGALPIIGVKKPALLGPDWDDFRTLLSLNQNPRSASRIHSDEIDVTIAHPDQLRAVRKILGREKAVRFQNDETYPKEQLEDSRNVVHVVIDKISKKIIGVLVFKMELTVHKLKVYALIPDEKYDPTVILRTAMEKIYAGIQKPAWFLVKTGEQSKYKKTHLLLAQAGFTGYSTHTLESDSIPNRFKILSSEFPKGFYWFFYPPPPRTPAEFDADDVHIRSSEGAIKDFEEISLLEEKSFQVPRDWKHFETDFYDEDADFLIASTRGRAIGYLEYKVHFDPGTVEIYRFAVQPGYRQRGIATHLFHRLFEIANRAGLTKMTYVAFPNTDPGIPFLESYGFTNAAVIPDYFEGGREGILYEYELISPLGDDWPVLGAFFLAPATITHTSLPFLLALGIAVWVLVPFLMTAYDRHTSAEKGSPGFRIRRAGKSDSQEIAAIFENREKGFVWGTTPETDPEFWHNFFSKDTWVAVDPLTDKIAGVVSLAPMWGQRRLEGFGVAPDYRNSWSAVVKDLLNFAVDDVAEPSRKFLISPIDDTLEEIHGHFGNTLGFKAYTSSKLTVLKKFIPIDIDPERYSGEKYWFIYPPPDPLDETFPIEKVKIRPLKTNEEFNALAAIDGELTDQPWTADEFKKVYQNLGRLFWVAEFEGALIGYLLFIDLKDEMDIMRFGVRPLYQHKGVGEKMFTSLIDQARRVGFRALTFSANESNSWIFPFIERMMFEKKNAGSFFQGAPHQKVRYERRTLKNLDPATVDRDKIQYEMIRPDPASDHINDDLGRLWLVEEESSADPMPLDDFMGEMGERNRVYFYAHIDTIPIGTLAVKLSPHTAQIMRIRIRPALKDIGTIKNLIQNFLHHEDIRKVDEITVRSSESEADRPINAALKELGFTVARGDIARKPDDSLTFLFRWRPPPKPAVEFDKIELKPVETEEDLDFLIQDNPWLHDDDLDVSLHDTFNGKGMIYAAYYEGKVIGVTGFLLDSEEIRLTALRVREQFRGFGVGTWMLNNLVDFIAGIHASTVVYYSPQRETEFTEFLKGRDFNFLPPAIPGFFGKGTVAFKYVASKREPSGTQRPPFNPNSGSMLPLPVAAPLFGVPDLLGFKGAVFAIGGVVFLTALIYLLHRRKRLRAFDEELNADTASLVEFLIKNKSGEWALAPRDFAKELRNRLNVMNDRLSDPTPHPLDAPLFSLPHDTPLDLNLRGFDKPLKTRSKKRRFKKIVADLPDNALLVFALSGDDLLWELRTARRRQKPGQVIEVAAASEGTAEKISRRTGYPLDSVKVDPSAFLDSALRLRSIDDWLAQEGYAQTGRPVRLFTTAERFVDEPGWDRFSVLKNAILIFMKNRMPVELTVGAVRTMTDRLQAVRIKRESA